MITFFIAAMACMWLLMFGINLAMGLLQSLAEIIKELNKTNVL